MEGVGAAVVKKDCEPNRLFWKARTALGLSRHELADAANGVPVMQGCGHAPMDENYVGRIEQGRIGGGMCPERLSALCVVLKVEDPALLGLVAGRRLPTRYAPARRREAIAVTDEASGALDRDPPEPKSSTASTAGEQGPASDVVIGSAVQVNVTAEAGAAVRVVCQDGAAGRVSVVAGGVRVLIDASGTDPAILVPTVVDVPAVAGGARVYSLAERRAR